MDYITVIPFELLYNILIDVNDLVNNLDIYEETYENFAIVVKSFINSYNKRFNKILSEHYPEEKNINWINEKEKLIKILVRKNDVDSLKFLLNNYNLSNDISYYIGYYGNYELIKSLGIKNFNSIAHGALDAQRFDMFKYAINNGGSELYYFLQIAKNKGYTDIEKYIEEKIAEQLNKAALKSKKNISHKLVNYLLNSNVSFNWMI